jgi:hypothetical protein
MFVIVSYMSEGKDGSPLKDANIAASTLHRELRGIQIDPVKVAIAGFGLGSAYYPTSEGKVTGVYVRRIPDPLSERDIWEPRGFTESDLRSGIVRLVTSREFDASEIYDRQTGMPRSAEQADELWMSGTGKIFRSRWEEGATSATFERDEEPLNPRYTDALRRVQRLSAIPKEIKATFGNYQAFKDALLVQGITMNGIDEEYVWRTDDLERPWIPFSVQSGLRTFVDVLIAAESLNPEVLDIMIDSGDAPLRTSLDGSMHPHRRPSPGDLTDKQPGLNRAKPRKPAGVTN